MGFRSVVGLPLPLKLPEWEGNYPSEVNTMIANRIYLRPIWVPRSGVVGAVTYANCNAATGRVTIGTYTDAFVLQGSHVIPTATLSVVDSLYTLLASTPWTVSPGRNWLAFQMEVGADQANGWSWTGLTQRSAPGIWKYNDPGSFGLPATIAAPLDITETGFNFPTTYSILFN